MTMNTPHHPTGGGASDAAAALKGASLAFNKTKPKPVPPPKPTTTTAAAASSPRASTVARTGLPGTPGAAASLAASTASQHTRSRSTSPVLRQHTGASPATSALGGRDGTADMRDRLSSFLASSPAAASHLSPHAAGTRVDHKNPSYIAATLAASRSASPSPQPHASPAALTPAQVSQLQQIAQQHSARRGPVLEEEDDEDGPGLPDTTSIPGTGHLISMFERGDEDVDPVKKSGGGGPRHPKPRPLTPEREVSPARAKAARMGIEEGREKPKPKPKQKQRPVTPTPVAERESSEAVTPQARKLVPKPAKPRPVTPPPGKSEDLSPSPAKAALKSGKPPVSPSKKPVQRRAESEQAPPPRKLQPAVEVRPSAVEAPGPRSVTQYTRVPITQTTRPEPKEPPAAPEPRRSRTKAKQAAPSSPKMIVRADAEVVSPKPKRAPPKAKPQPPTPPQPRGTGGKAKEPEPEAPAFTKPKSMALVHGHAPLQEPFFPRPESTRPESARPSTADTSSSNDTFVSASSGHTAVPDLTPVRPPTQQTPSALSTPGRSSMNSSPTRTTPRRTPGSSATSLPLNALSNAIMAGSLAAARLTPSNTGNSVLSPPPPLLPSRTKSPRLRQTLRQPPSKSDDEDEMRKKKHQRASNKHSHAEGARRRWRDEITLRERRRYEAVWASNRGLLLATFAPQGFQGEAPPPRDAAECVVNVVAREIWRRSRLPQEELAEVWGLVDRGRRGMLSKQEFVVGMWLIDQRLRGRKIPNKVSSSVWDSAQGVKVKSPKAKR